MLTRCTDDDVPGIVALVNRAYRNAGASSGWSTEAGCLSGDRTTQDLLRADLGLEPDAVQLTWEGAQSGALKGSAWLERVDEDSWYLGSLAIDPAQQNGGHGRHVLAAAEQWFGEHGGRRVRMTVVNVRDALIAWYLRRGYRMTGETIPFPYGDNRFGTPLRDDLAFVVLEKTLHPACDVV